MPTTYSNLLRLAKQATGENSNTWGTILNDNTFEMLEDAIAGLSTVVVAGSNITLTTANGTVDEARSMCIKFTGSPVATRTITIPSSSKIYVMHNALSTAQSVTITTGAGATVSLLQNMVTLVYCDGVNVYSLFTLTPGSIGTTEIADNAITKVKMADNSVGTVEIEDDAVTFAKMQNIATSRLLGRTTAGSGNVEELTVGAGLTLSGGVLAAQPIVVDHAVSSYSTSLSAATDFMPFSTIPTNTQGREILSVTITPKSTTNKLHLKGWITLQLTIQAQFTIACFVNGTSTALKTNHMFGLPAHDNYMFTVPIEHEFVPGTVSPVTISIRVGVASGNYTVNQYGGGNSLGAFLSVDEIYAV